MRQRGTGLITASPDQFVKNARPKKFLTDQTTKKSRFTLRGGPWDGASVLLCELPTAWMTIRGEKGRYGGSGAWEAADA